MTYNELYVLNSAIDGEDICSVQKFSSNRLTRVAVELIKDMLIEKGVLEDYNTLTTKGVLETRRIKQFKEAKKYVRIINMIIGFLDDKKGILLTVDKKGEYYFSTIDPSKNVDVLMEAFPELLQYDDASDSQDNIDTYVSPRDLLKEYKINVKTSFTLNTEYLKAQEKNKKELFFEANGKKYYYDCVTNKLHERNSYEIVNILRKRLEVI